MYKDQMTNFAVSSGNKASFNVRWKAIVCITVLTAGGLGWSLSLSHMYLTAYLNEHLSDSITAEDYPATEAPAPAATNTDEMVAATNNDTKIAATIDAEQFAAAKCFNSTDELRQVLKVYLHDKSSYQYYFAKDYGYPIGLWCTKFITDFSALFSSRYSGDSVKGSFNEDVSSWDTSNGVLFSSMFALNRQFNQDVSGWNVSAGRQFDYMFAYANSFDQDLSLWNVKNGRDFSSMFKESTFGSPAKAHLNRIASWDVSSGQTFDSMFYGSKFGGNLNLTAWNMSKAKILSGMFAESAVVDGGVGAWDVSSVMRFDSMFSGARQFQANLSSWNTSSGVRFDGMFQEAAKFDSDLSGWDMSHARGLTRMFYRASSFCQNLCQWQNAIANSTYDPPSYSNRNDGAGVKEIFMGTKCVATVEPIPLLRGPWCLDCAKQSSRNALLKDGLTQIGRKDAGLAAEGHGPEAGSIARSATTPRNAFRVTKGAAEVGPGPSHTAVHRQVLHT